MYQHYTQIKQAMDISCINTKHMSAEMLDMLYKAITMPKATTRYEGLNECRKNVVRTNNSRKLQYCKVTKED